VAKLENCELEWDVERGVLYIHNKDTGRSAVRICGLPKVDASMIDLENGLLDVIITDMNLVAIPHKEEPHE